MIKKTETEIMKNWHSYDAPVVSILCTTYNHENYTEEAIDSFLMQETNFPFEIIIHDDASTDNTVNKIKAYAEKYPRIIKTILQEENQYSKGKKVFLFLFEKAKGKYHALCEGDDYWIDSKKLQIQIDLMEQNPQCALSCHPAEERFKNDKHGKAYAKHANGNKIFSTSEVILFGGNFCPTASIIYRQELVSNLPSFFNNVPTGDYFIQILGSFNGGALYIDKFMSVYRKGVPSSWSTSMENIEKKEKWSHDLLASLNDLDIYFDKKYHNEIQQVISEHYYHLSLYYFNCGMYKKFKKSIESSINIHKPNYIIYYIYYYFRSFPKLIKYFRKLKYW